MRPIQIVKHSLWVAAVTTAVSAGVVYAQSVGDRKSEYQRDLDIYRNAQSLFEVKKSEYDQFKTFAAEDELVKAAQQVLLARDDVWIAYWQLLAAEFNTLSPNATKVKDEWQTRFKTETDWLGQNKVNVNVAKTRSALLVEATALNDKNDELGAMAYEANGDISVSKVVQATQALQAFNRGLTERVDQQHLSATDKEIKVRGLTVNAERIQSLLDRLEGLRAELKNNAGFGSGDSFSQITDDLDPLYSELAQQYQVAHELATGVEW